MSENPVDVGGSVLVQVRAVDNVGVQSRALTLDGQPVVLDTNAVATISASAVGVFTLVGSATDASGNTGQASETLTVADPSDVDAPVVALTTPAPGDVVTAPTDVIGTVDDDEPRLLHGVHCSDERRGVHRVVPRDNADR